MKKIISILLMCSALTFSSPSHAIVGLASADVPLIVVGALGVGAGTLGTGFALDYCFTNGGDLGGMLCGFIFYAVGLPSIGVGMLGLILLDDGHSNSTRFSKLGAPEAAQLGVSDADRLTYNSNLEELNEIVEQISNSVSSIDDRRVAFETAQNQWAQYEAGLDPRALVVAKKISAQVSKRN